MDYVSGKVTMLVGEASSRVNDTRRKWQRQRDNRDGSKGGDNAISSAIDDQILSATSRANRPQQASNRQQQQHSIYSSPLAGGMPFGGDSHTRSGPLPPPPPIGFRTDLAAAAAVQDGPNEARAGSRQSPARYPIGIATPDRVSPRPEDGTNRVDASNVNASDESLYKGDAWARLWFQRVMILCLLRLLLFVRKVYEDFQATKLYNLTGQTGHFMAAAATLFLPTIVFTIYRVSRYLQLTLPPLRVIKAEQRPYPEAVGGGAAADQSETAEPVRPKRAADAADKRSKKSASSTRRAGGGDDDNEEAQLTRALMSSPDQSTSQSIGTGAQSETADGPVAATRAQDDNEGLVTARQTPTTLDEFHDTKSVTSGGAAEPAVVSSKSRATGLDAVPPSPSRLESVNVDKLLGDTADRETTRVVTGASEQILHGCLYIFWQLKRQVDVMGYLVERACLWRKPAEREKEELDRLRTGSDGLEWFQDFYAAFLAILAQVYTLGLHWSGDTGPNLRSVSGAQLGAATSGLSSAELSTGSSGGGGDLSISQSARTVSDLLSSQAIAGNTLGGKDVLIMSELIVSTAVVMSLLIAVRRRDDGILTLALSMLGWGSLFSARIIIIALAFVHLSWHLMLPLVVLHVLLITLWIYSIALASHNDKPSERLDEAKWDEETAIEVSNQLELEAVKKDDEGQDGQAADKIDGQTDGQQALSSDTAAAAAVGGGSKKEATSGTGETSCWSFMEHVVLLSQVLILFAIPSLFYWPIMFNLKRHLRPFKYLVLILIENFLLIPAIWFSIAEPSATPGQLYLLGTVGGFSIVGFIFISLYISCKPSLTEYFARADELFNESESSGIYYEFCSRVFKMPDLSKQTFRRLMNQSEAVEIVSEEEEEVEE